MAIKKRPHEYSPTVGGGTNGLELEAGDNSRFLNFNIKLMELPKIDLADSAQVQRRISEYFSLNAAHDLKPTVTGLGMALGMDRRRLWEAVNDIEGRNGILSSTSRDSIKKAYQNLEILWEHYMLNGKINPVSGIFMGKNHFGMRDQQDLVIAASNPLGEARSVEAAQQYAKQLEAGMPEDE